MANAKKKTSKQGCYYRLPEDCLKRLSRASKRLHKTKTELLVEAIRAQVPMYSERAVKLAGAA